MNLLPKVLLWTAASFGISLAAHKDLFFNPSIQNGCLTADYFQNKSCKEDIVADAYYTAAPVRLRFIDPPLMESATYKFYMERPFFIIDGIHLSVDEKRSLEQFEKEAEEFGIPEILKSLGYTPVLVQFSETVARSLESNASALAKLFAYLNSNSKVPFPEKQKSGFVVLGISQGGILGRYASYLYDKGRTSSDAPIRFYASLDSPHQGAVMPRSLVATIDYWAREAGVASAEAFNDLISSPGARDLLIYDTSEGNETFEPKTGKDRFLFGDYRKAAEYKGFPAVLISQGQLKGKNPAHASTYFKMNRRAKSMGSIWGRAESEMSPMDKSSGKYAFNRMYEFPGDIKESSKSGVTKFDFVQGSTYPFARTMYDALHEGMLEAMPDTFSKSIKVGGLTLYNMKLSSAWDFDSLYQANSTFIPTTSAMDLLCNGDLSVRSDCAFNQSATGISYEKPGARSTATATYAVDPTHPRYNESISGRHIESPVKDGRIDKGVLNGMQTDIWRVLCELAKVDYDAAAKTFRNPKLGGMFAPTTSCMDQTKMPSLIKEGGVLQTQKFAYARYDYNGEATEKNRVVNFNLPAGWNRVAAFDNGSDLVPGSIFEVDVKVGKHKGNWMRAELILAQDKNGRGHFQLMEQNVPVDDLSHTLRWQMPATAGALSQYRWFRLVLNSEGASVTLSNPKVVMSAIAADEKYDAIPSKVIYPNTNYKIVPWSDTISVVDYSDALGSGVKMEKGTKLDGFHFKFWNTYSMDSYKNLVVKYWPGTCQNTDVFFDSKKTAVNLGNGILQNGMLEKKIPLEKVVNTALNPNQPKSASRLSLQVMNSSEKCVIQSVYLE